MAEPLRVLLLEDVPTDAELVERELRKTYPDCVVQCVDERDGFEAALETFAPHAVLSDHRLATFSGMDALRVAKARRPDLPFIFVTGSLDEETAVECIKAGAWDYILKERLVRLGAAVTAALDLKRTRDELHQSQQQFLHAQKLEAVGRLAGGVAHDFNNLTTCILGACHLIAESLPSDDPRQEDLTEIREAAERATGLTRQLLAFSRKGVTERQPVHLNSVVRGVHRLLERLIGEDVELVTHLDPEVAWIQADPGQMEQVVVNLAVNARDAMPDGGRLLIETRHLPPPAQGNEAGGGVELIVTDFGTGMDPETRARIFEPFFTTKGSQGTGLGLATVDYIVRSTGGRIEVESTLGRGTVFRVWLPELAEPAQAAPAASGQEERLTGTETILVVEDQDSVRRLAVRILKAQGYKVLDARSGTDALAISARPDVDIDLLITDLVMPGLGGQEVAWRLRSTRPQVRIIFASGYPDPELLPRDELREGTGVLQKPYSPDDLARKVRQVLDGKTERTERLSP